MEWKLRESDRQDMSISELDKNAMHYFGFQNVECETQDVDLFQKTLISLKKLVRINVNT